jgi:hypothetical protein
VKGSCRSRSERRGSWASCRAVALVAFKACYMCGG